MTTQSAVLRYRVEAFLMRHCMAPTQLGRHACEDNNLVRDIRKGRKLRPATSGRLIGFMVGYERALKEGKGHTRTRTAPTPGV